MALDLSARLYPKLFKRALSQLMRLNAQELGDFAADVTNVVNSLRDGRMNVVAHFTPDALATSTVILDSLIVPNSMIQILPANSAAVSLGAAVADLTTMANGTVTVSHDPAVGTEIYRYAVIG